MCKLAGRFILIGLSGGSHSGGGGGGRQDYLRRDYLTGLATSPTPFRQPPPHPSDRGFWCKKIRNRDNPLKAFFAIFLHQLDTHPNQLRFPCRGCIRQRCSHLSSQVDYNVTHKTHTTQKSCFWSLLVSCLCSLCCAPVVMELS